MLNSITIKNFKKIQDELTLTGLAPVNYLVGENGSGKSSVLEAIQMYALSKDLINTTTQNSLTLFDSFLGQFMLKRFTGIVNLTDKYSGDLENKLIEIRKNFIVIDDVKHFLCENNEFFLHDIVTKITNSRSDDTHENPSMGEELHTSPFDTILIDYLDIEQLNGYKWEWLSITSEFETTEFLNKLGIGYEDDSDGFSFAEGKIKILRLMRLVLYLLRFYDKRIILIEEPESCLHPKYQKLIPVIINRFLGFDEFKDKQNNFMFFISTHSPFIVRSALNLDGQKIYHLKNGQLISDFDKNKTFSEGVTYFDETLKHLGFEMKDIFYPNCLIYVEGAYDILYLEYLLRLYEEKLGPKIKLTKGLDFAFVEYGGALASHLTVDQVISLEDQEIDETKLVNIFNLNRRVFLITDNDGSKSNFEFAKKRLESISKQKEFKDNFIFYKERHPDIKTFEDYLKQLKKAKKNKFFYRKTKNMGYTLINIREWKNQKYTFDDFNFDPLQRLIIGIYDQIRKWNDSIS